MSRAKYRPDIDGLLALAVLPVVLFHAHVPGFSGGFVGVDIFFVISGYLITSILVREMRDGTYTLAGFYERRIRRIIPALMFMLAVTLAVGMLILLPAELAELGKSSISASLFASNVFFHAQTGYFDTAAVAKPLLHTWSLAVEEQYYIFFPIALWVGYRWLPRWVFAGVLLGAVLSFLMSVVLLGPKPSFTFYMLPTRAWELFVGGIVAMMAWRPAKRHGLIALAGVATILVAVVAYDEAMPFPGAAALLPVLGAAAIIFAGEGTAVGRVLSLAPLRGIGLISYSLYLWHWPIIVYARFLWGPDFTPAMIAGCLTLSFAMAWISWRYVERPFRAHQIAGRGPAGALVAGGATIAVACAASLVLLSGLPARLPGKVVAIAAAAQAPGEQPNCFAQPGSAVDSVACLDDPKGRPKIILWGDSHALQFVDALSAVAAPKGFAVRLSGRASCLPLVGVQLSRFGKADQSCAAGNAKVLAQIVADPDVRTVVLSGRWARLSFPMSDPESQQLMSGNGAKEAGLFARSLLGMIDQLRAAGKRVVLVGDVPEFDQPLPNCLARSIWMPWTGRHCLHKTLTLPGSPSDREMAAIAAARPDIVFVRPADALCREGRCMTMIGDQPVSKDEDHLSDAGALHVVRTLRVADLL